MTKPFKPLLAETVTDFKSLEFPLLASPKLDGIRCLVIDDGEGNPKAVSRKLKPIPNDHIRTTIEKDCPIGWDGEILTYTEDGVLHSYSDVSSSVMRVKGEPIFAFHVFDDFTSPETAFADRDDQLARHFREHVEHNGGISGPDCCDYIHVEHELLDDQAALDEYEAKCLGEGWEGVMTRSLGGRYKYGRSTEREQILLKVKRFADDEAVVVGFEELMHNANEATVGELGQTKRSTHKANQVPMGKLGALLCVTKEGIEFKIGTGFDDVRRQQIWRDRGILKGRTVKFKHQTSGAKEAPRFPVWLGWRYQGDM